MFYRDQRVQKNAMLYEKMESLNIPFRSMNVTQFADQINSMNSENFSIMDMSNAFQEWRTAGHWEEDSDLVSLLTDFVPR